jgi:hypothetical protein
MRMGESERRYREWVVEKLGMSRQTTQEKIPEMLGLKI